MVRDTPVDRDDTHELDLHGLHVLVVDDEESPRELFRDMLVLAGARVTVTPTAYHALTVIKQEAPDVLVTDIMMPNEDGYWLIEAVRELATTYGGWRPRAIAVTGDAVTHSAERALRAGFDAHLAKPVSVDVLQAAVARLAGRC